MIKFIESLRGKKTYIIAFIIAGVSLAQGFGWIDQTVANILFGILGGGGLAALRDGITQREGKKKGSSK